MVQVPSSISRRPKRRRAGQCAAARGPISLREGRKSVAEMNPETAALARSLRKEGERTRTLREIADILFASGHKAAPGKAYAPSVVAHMLRAA